MTVAKESRPDAKWQPVFKKERAAYARPSETWTATAKEEGLKVTLTLKPGSGARPLNGDETVIFFTEDGWINTDEPQPQEIMPDGGLTIHLTRADVYLSKTIPTNLHGIVQRVGGWELGKAWRSLSISPKIDRP